MQGNVFHIQRFSLFDGPGVRTIVFLKGCPLHCVWCHNPEGIKGESQLLYRPGKCIGCGECAVACPNKLHDILDGLHTFSRDNCVSCGTCTRVCCSGALSLAGQMMDVTTVIDTVMRDFSVYQESGGGITLSGGEPFYQPEYALALLREAKKRGLNTCVETCGQTSSATILAAAEYTDYFYYDYKATGNELHKKLCGVPQDLILNNLAKLNDIHAHVTLRCPIIPGQNETPEHIQGIIKTAAAYDCIREIHLEPYHKLGISKAEQLGWPDGFHGSVPDHEQMERYREEIQKISGKNCIIN